MEGRLSVIYGGGLHTKHRHMNYHDFFASRIDKGDRVLDVGCGNGAVAHTVAQKTGARIVGIDLLEENIAAAKHKHDHPKVRYVVGDVLQVIPEGEFTVVVLSNVLEHLPRRPEFLSSMVRHTGVNRVLIRVPLFERDWRVPLKKELGIEWRLDTTHETEYTMEEFLEEMELAGLFVVHHEVRWGEIWAEVEASHA